jgi:CRP/FNR family cyclic AMP-dependent transcriptional regulator
MPIHAWPDIFGYLAGGLLLLTFLMREMVPLRAVAIASSAAWLVYGWADHIYPVVLVHLMMLPLNGVRLHQALRTQPHNARRALRAAVRVPSSR